MGVILRSIKSLRSIVIFLHYDPQLFTKVKIISVYILYHQEQHDNFPNSNGRLTGILKGFKGKEIQFDFIQQADMPLLFNIILCHFEAKPNRSPNLTSKQNAARLQANLVWVRKHVCGPEDSSSQLVHPNLFGCETG